MWGSWVGGGVGAGVGTRAAMFLMLVHNLRRLPGSRDEGGRRWGAGDALKPQSPAAVLPKLPMISGQQEDPELRIALPALKPLP